MKQAKKIFLLLLLVGITSLTTGCFKRDSLEDIEIMTTVYPIEYVTNYLYGEHSLVNSIYPDDTNTYDYTLSEKQMNDYSKKELFIYNAVTKDKDIALDFLERNNDLLIIDASSGIDLTYGTEELWLNPSHLLMMSQNIKNGLEEYITNSYLKKEIDDRYKELQVTLSELDAEIKLTAENATYKTIVVSNDTLKFLEKYGFTVYSLDDRNSAPTEKTINDVKNLIKNGQVSTIFILQYDSINSTIQGIIDETRISTTEFKRLDSITDEERDNKEDYVTLMNDNIDLLKNTLYQQEEA